MPAHPRLLVLALLLPASTQAHFRWFVEGSPPDVRFPTDGYSFLVVFGAVLFTFSAVFIHRRSWPWADRLTERASAQVWDWRICGMAAGIMLLANAASGVFLAHNLELAHPAHQHFASVLQLTIGVLLVGQLSYRWAGFLILLTALFAIYAVAWATLRDYVIEFVGLAFTLIFIAPAVRHFDRGNQHRTCFALPCLRITIGLSLVVLAIHNKLSNPGLGVAFLSEYPFNFMPALGFAGFTDLHFVVAAGTFELVFGLLITFGIATRYVTIVVSVFFVLTLILLGISELIGHLPLIGAAIVLIYRGGRLVQDSRTSCAAASSAALSP